MFTNLICHKRSLSYTNKNCTPYRVTEQSLSEHLSSEQLPSEQPPSEQPPSEQLPDEPDGVLYGTAESGFVHHRQDEKRTTLHRSLGADAEWQDGILPLYGI